MKNKVLINIVASGLLLIFSVLSFTAVLGKNQTSDEAVHLAAGYEYLKNRDYRWNPEHPPLLKETAALPLLLMNLKTPHESEAYKNIEQWGYSENFLYDANAGKEFRILNSARFMMLLYGILLGAVLFAWSGEMFGGANALIVLAIYCFSPNMLGHAPLITTDIGSATFAFSAFYLLWKLFRSKKLFYLICCAAVMSLALSSKHSVFIVFPILTVMVFIGSSDREYQNTLQNFLKKHFIMILLFCPGIILFFSRERIFFINRIILLLAAAVIILSAMTVLKVKIRVWIKKERFRRFMDILYRLSDYLLPVCFTFLVIFGLSILLTFIPYLDYKNTVFSGKLLTAFENLKYIIKHATDGHGWIFMNGKYSRTGFPFYYLYVFLIKTPVHELLFILAGIAALFPCRKTFMDKAFLVIPPVMFMALISVFNKAQIGVRHEFFIYPFFFMTGGVAMRLLSGFKNRFVAYFYTCMICSWIIVASFTVYPDYISFTNGLFFKPENAYLHISDSNLDWGQNMYALKTYLEKRGSPVISVCMHYEYLLGRSGYANYIPVSAEDVGPEFKGLLAIDVQEYNKNPGWFTWLKQFRKPQTIIKSNILIFEL